MKVKVVTAENLLEDTIKETVSVICICSPCLIRITVVNKGMVCISSAGHLCIPTNEKNGLGGVGWG